MAAPHAFQLERMKEVADVPEEVLHTILVAYNLLQRLLLLLLVLWS